MSSLVSLPSEFTGIQHVFPKVQNALKEVLKLELRVSSTAFQFSNKVNLDLDADYVYNLEDSLKAVDNELSTYERITGKPGSFLLELTYTNFEGSDVVIGIGYQNDFIETRNTKEVIQEFLSLLNQREERIDSKTFINDLVLAYSNDIKVFRKGIGSLNSIKKLDVKLDLYSKLIRSKKYLEDHFSLNVSLDEISEEALISKFHFARLFKAVFDCSPITYVIQLRVEHAKKRLVNEPEISITQIANELGYKDSSYFNKQFKSVTGLAPSIYRQQNVI